MSKHLFITIKYFPILGENEETFKNQRLILKQSYPRASSSPSRHQHQQIGRLAVNGHE